MRFGTTLVVEHPTPNLAHFNFNMFDAKEEHSNCHDDHEGGGTPRFSGFDAEYGITIGTDGMRFGFLRLF